MNYKEEFFKVVYNKKLNEFEVHINKDLIEQYKVTYQQVKKNLDYDLINKLKNNLIRVLENGDLLRDAK